MLVLDFKSAQEVVFPDAVARGLLPEFEHLFDSWTLGTCVPAMRQAAKRAVLEFLERVDDRHAALLSAHLGDDVVVERLDPNIVMDLSFPVTDPEIPDAAYPNVAATRGRDVVRVTFWR